MLRLHSSIIELGVWCTLPLVEMSCPHRECAEVLYRIALRFMTSEKNWTSSLVVLTQMRNMPLVNRDEEIVSALPSSRLCDTIVLNCLLSLKF